MPEFISDDDFVRMFQVRAKQHGHFRGTPLGNAGPLTLEALDRILPNLAPEVAKRPPWIDVGLETLGWHEKTDNANLARFLKRDGRTLGDPSKLPWCGDWVETTMRLGLPHEDLPDPVGTNPYWARNWAAFGRKLDKPCLHCVVGFSRDGGGHVGYAVSQDSECWHVFGGNQGDRVSTARLAKSRLLFARWPTTWEGEILPVPQRSGSDLPNSVNEF